ncbi:MAG: TMEM175 family protein [Acidothermaceae bacterium]
MKTSRLEAFSDGVLAIIITIMVLGLKSPHGHTLASLRDDTGTAFLTYLLSFVYVGIYWTNHHHMLQLTSRVTGGVLWANLVLLFCISLFPFTIGWVDDTNFAPTPVVTYGVDLLAAAVAYYILQNSIMRIDGDASPLRRAIGRDLKGKASPAFYIVGILCAALVGPGRLGSWLAMACFVAVAVMWLVPDRRLERAIGARSASAGSEPDDATGLGEATAHPR